MSNYNDATTLDFLNDDEGLVMASLCMVVLIWERYDEVMKAVEVGGAYSMRDFAKSIAYLGQVIDEDLSSSDPLVDTSAQCWEALDCCDFDHEYQERVLDFFLQDGLEHASMIAQNDGDTEILFAAGEALRESFLEEIEAYVEGFGEDYDGQPDEAQEWHDFDPDC